MANEQELLRFQNDINVNEGEVPSSKERLKTDTEILEKDQKELSAKEFEPKGKKKP
jgi:hypothetical protein